MNFDIKDIKSWANRHDVKVGDEGYLSYDITTLVTKEDAKPTKLDHIYNDKASCFSSIEYSADYPFFLPLNAVKKEKEYRPFRTIAEVDELLAKDSVKHYCYVGSDLYLRYKAKPNIIKHILITNLEVDTNTNELRFINGFTTNHLAKNFDIKIAGRWISFGVEVKND